jgi:prophage tail gpP-like protein
MARILRSPIDKTLPISLKIAGKDFIHFDSITVTRSISSFVDSFNIVINNPNGMYSRQIPAGARVDMYSQGVLFFR